MPAASSGVVAAVVANTPQWRTMAADNYGRLRLLPAPKYGGEPQPTAARQPWPHPAQRRTRDADELVLVADSGRGVGVRGARRHALGMGAKKVSGSIS